MVLISTTSSQFVLPFGNNKKLQPSDDLSRKIPRKIQFWCWELELRRDLKTKFIIEEIWARLPTGCREILVNGHMWSKPVGYKQTEGKEGGGLTWKEQFPNSISLICIPITPRPHFIKLLSREYCLNEWGTSCTNLKFNETLVGNQSLLSKIFVRLASFYAYRL